MGTIGEVDKTSDPLPGPEPTDTSSAGAAPISGIPIPLGAMEDVQRGLPICVEGFGCPQKPVAAHLQAYRHPCQAGKDCAAHTDPQHCRLFFHHQVECPEGPYCIMKEHGHEKWYAHAGRAAQSATESDRSPNVNYHLPVMCPVGPQCQHRDFEPHAAAVAHMCSSADERPYGCQRLHDVKHVERCLHPLLPEKAGEVEQRRVPACRAGWRCRLQDDQRHMRAYTHPCSSHCDIMKDENHPLHKQHRRQHVHPCPNGSGCKYNEQRLKSSKAAQGKAAAAAGPGAGAAAAAAAAAAGPAAGAAATTSEIVMHGFLYTHDCQFGGECKQLSDPSHVAHYVHPCPEGCATTKSCLCCFSFT